LKFICKYVDVQVENASTPFTSRLKMGQTIKLPVAHKDGNYYVDEDTLQQLKKNGQVVLRYSEDVNGSVDRIAAVTNRQGNVVGMMPTLNVLVIHSWGLRWHVFVGGRLQGRRYAKVGTIKSEVMGLAVFNGSKMVGELDGEETQLQLMLEGNFGYSYVTIPDPEAEDYVVLLNIKQNRKPKRKVEIVDEKPI